MEWSLLRPWVKHLHSAIFDSETIQMNRYNKIVLTVNNIYTSKSGTNAMFSIWSNHGKTA